MWHNRSFPGHPGAKFAHFGDSEDVPKARGDLRTSMEPPANFAPDSIIAVHFGLVQRARTAIRPLKILRTWDGSETVGSLTPPLPASPCLADSAGVGHPRTTPAGCKTAGGGDVSENPLAYPIISRTRWRRSLEHSRWRRTGRHVTDASGFSNPAGGEPAF